MQRPDINRFGEMEVFVQVVERGGLSAAARAMLLSPSAVSKLMARLEARLGVRLLHRSTRKLQLTSEGQQFYERSVRVLAELDEAERSVSTAALPRGRVTINTSVSFGTHVLAPLVPRFIEELPQITLDIVLTDRVVDLIDERADIAVRWGPLPSSDLVARRLGETAQVIVASPGYLARHGTPRKPSELEAHQRLDFSYRRRVPDWPFRIDGRAVSVPVRGNVRAHDGETLRNLAVAGAGLVRLSQYNVQTDIDAGRLVPVLQKYNPHDVEPIHAVYLGKLERLPSRVRAVLDFLSAHVSADPRFGGRPSTAPAARARR